MSKVFGVLSQARDSITQLLDNVKMSGSAIDMLVAARTDIDGLIAAVLRDGELRVWALEKGYLPPEQAAVLRDEASLSGITPDKMAPTVEQRVTELEDQWDRFDRQMYAYEMLTPEQRRNSMNPRLGAPYGKRPQTSDTALRVANRVLTDRVAELTEANGGLIDALKTSRDADRHKLEAANKEIDARTKQYTDLVDLLQPAFNWVQENNKTLGLGSHYTPYIVSEFLRLKAAGDDTVLVPLAYWNQQVDAGAKAAKRIAELEAEATQTHADADSYANAWHRELGSHRLRKTHHIDACVVATRVLVATHKQMVEKLDELGYSVRKTDDLRDIVIDPKEPSLEAV